MARPFQSVDAPLQRQQAFSQYGGAPTRESRLQNPKDPGAGMPPDLLLSLMQNPAMAPILQMLMQNPEHAEQFAFAKPGAHMTNLTPQQRALFMAWLKSIGRGPGSGFEDYTKAGADYDMPRYWLEVARRGLNRTGINPADQKLHFPDTYKLPNEPGFSAESIYARPDSPFRWFGETLVDTRTGERVSGQPLGTIPMYGGNEAYARVLSHLLGAQQ